MVDQQTSVATQESTFAPSAPLSRRWDRRWWIVVAAVVLSLIVIVAIRRCFESAFKSASS